MVSVLIIIDRYVAPTNKKMMFPLQTPFRFPWNSGNVWHPTFVCVERTFETVCLAVIKSRLGTESR
jgi:hypothetical protein